MLSAQVRSSSYSELNAVQKQLESLCMMLCIFTSIAIFNYNVNENQARCQMAYMGERIKRGL